MMPPPSLLDARDLSGATPKRVRSGVVVPFTNENFEGEMLLFVLVYMNKYIPKSIAICHSRVGHRILWGYRNTP